MNFLNRHYCKINESYFEHFWFAGKLAYVFLFNAIALSIHAVFPFLPMHERLNLSALIEYLQKLNIKRERSKERKL
jgi:hypothetical protein